MSRNINNLLKYSLLKISLIPLMLLLISTLVFVLLRIAPGDPVDAILGSGADETSREILRYKLGLNEPLIDQYLDYIKNILHLDLGLSLSTQESVAIIVSLCLQVLNLGFFVIECNYHWVPFGFLGLINRGKKKIILENNWYCFLAIPPFGVQ